MYVPIPMMTGSNEYLKRMMHIMYRISREGEDADVENHSGGRQSFDLRSRTPGKGARDRRSDRHRRRWREFRCFSSDGPCLAGQCRHRP